MASTATGCYRDVAMLRPWSLLAAIAALVPATSSADTPGLAAAPDPAHILGGQATDPGEYDGVVALTIGSDLCSGTVVAPRLILTAAHCLVEADSIGRVVVRFGDDVYGQHVDATSWGFHPEYCRECGTDIHDYGYVTIGVDFEVPGGYTLPIVDQDEWDALIARGAPLELVGYGGEMEVEDTILGAGLKRVTQSEISGITPRGFEFKAGGHGHDTCGGDSGGPAFARLADGTLRLAGITSRGSRPCGGGGYYGTPYPALCWVRDETGVDLVGEDCSACDCLDIAPPPSHDRCAVADADAGDAIAPLVLLALVGRRAARRRQKISGIHGAPSPKARPSLANAVALPRTAPSAASDHGDAKPL